MAFSLLDPRKKKAAVTAGGIPDASLSPTTTTGGVPGNTAGFVPRTGGVSQTQRGKERSASDPESIFEKAGDTIRDTVKDIRDEGRYIPYEDDVTEAQDMTRAVDTTYTPSNVTSILNPGEESIAGDYYAGYEKDALGNLVDKSTGQSAAIGADVVALKKKLEEAQTPLEKAIAEQDLLAVTGQLTQPGSQYFEAKSKLLDQAAQDERDAAMEALGASRGVAGGKQQKAMSDIANKMYLEKQSFLGEIGTKAEDAARQNSLALKGLNNDILKSAIDIAKTGNATELEASKAITDHVQQAAQSRIQATQLKLNESLANLEASFKSKELQLKQAGDMAGLAKWKNEYDIAQKAALSDAVNSFFDTLGGVGEDLMSGGGNLATGITSILA